MEILQYYYTSFINKETGSAGFQVKAMSRDIMPETQAMIARLMAYRIPPALNERKISTHPVALRYYYLNAQECLLICSQSNGNDPNGRPGNFFAHVLVADSSLFTSVPPIFYWNSDFWLKEDTATRTELEALPEIPGDPALDFDEMWHFLQDGRLDNFFKLMCAVVDGANSRRRIIIIDSAEHVALWVAAISCMLPEAYRPLLSFTTYHHDPYQSQFFITGTPVEAQFRFSPSDYESYFVINENKVVSEVKDSLYAKLVHQFTTPEMYDDKMLAFFSKYRYRFPNPTAIDDRLDLMALYASIMGEEDSTADIDDKRRAIDLVLPTFEHLKNYTDEDIQDLQQLGDFLWKTYEESDDVKFHKLHQRVVDLQELHKLPTEKTLKKQILHYTRQLFVDDAFQTWEHAHECIEELYQKYRENNVFINQVNQTTYLSSLTKKAMQVQPDHLVRVWTSLGPYLLPEPPCLPLFAWSIRVWSSTFKKGTQAPRVGHDLFNAIHSAIRKQDQVWLKLLVSGFEQKSVEIEPEYLELFYRTLMLRISSLEQREPYRKLVFPTRADIVEIELLDDLEGANFQSMLPVLLKWIVYVRPTQSDTAALLVAKGLPKLRQKCNDKQWRMVARQCLMEAELVPLLRENEPLLVKDAFTDITLDQFVPEYVELYRRYYHHPVLSDPNKVVLSAMLAMHQRHLNKELAGDLCDYLSSLPLEMYEAEVRSVCDAFFAAQLSNEQHFLLIFALFVWKYEERFWSIYWQKVALQSPQALNQLMVFWFSSQPLNLPQRYATHHFLLNLQDNLESFQKFPDFEKALSVLKGQPWYLAVQESNPVRKNALGALVMKQFQKRLSNQKGDEEVQEEQHQFNAEMKRLFEPDNIREMHLGTLMNIYQKQQPEPFWEAYKDRLVQLLLSDDVQTVVELFSFWFDDAHAFGTLGRGPYIAQSFLIGLPQVFESARKKHETNFGKMSQQIRSYAKQSQSMVWYALIRKYLAETDTVEKKHRLFGR